MDSARVHRFYGMNIASNVLSVRREHLIDLETDDLFDAHLGRNFGYFGAVDKTLSGFVVLDDTGDDYWLFDARDSQGVYFQDHEERLFSFEFDSIAAYARWKKEAGRAHQPPSRAEQERPAPAPSRRAVSTEALGKRLQWAVWFFGQPLRQAQTGDAMNESNALGWFLDAFPNETALLQAFERECGHLANDPHLAVSWLLAAAACADESLLARITDAGPRSSDLFSAFAAKLVGVGRNDTLPVLPLFRTRRARFLQGRAVRHADADLTARDLVRSLTVDPRDRGVDKALTLALRVEAAGKSAFDVRAYAAEVPASPAQSFLRAFADRIAGETESADAGAFVHAVDGASLDDPDTDAVMGALTVVAPLAADKKSLAATLRRFLTADPFHFGLLDRAASAAEACADSDAAALRARATAIGAIRPIYSEWGSGKKGPISTERADALDDDRKHLLAQRILAAPESFVPPAIDWAVLASVLRPFVGRGEGLVRAFAQLGFPMVNGLVKKMRAAAAVPDEALAKDLEALVAAAPPANDIVRAMGYERLVKAILPWIAERQAGGDASAIDAMLARLETAPASLRVVLLDVSFAQAIARMTDAQAARAAKALLAMQRAGKGESPHLYFGAGRALSGLAHAGAEVALLEALDVESDAEVTGNIFSALVNLGTPRAREAVVRRAFEERKNLGPVVSALERIADDELHTEILELLKTRKDAVFGANVYAAALGRLTKKTKRMTELGRAALEMASPRDDVEKGALACVLYESAWVALEARRLADARALVDAAAALGVAPATVSPRWTNPFETADGAQRLKTLQSGELERKQNAMRERAAAAKVAHQPLVDVTDDDLRDLAGAPMGPRLFHDRERGTVWVLTGEGDFAFFDGFAITAPPFQVVVDPDWHALAAGASGFGERLTFWTLDAKHFVDVVRYGAAVFVGRGVNNGAWSHVGLVFPRESDAAEAMARFTASPPEGFAQSEPWRVEGKGPIQRTLYHPKSDGSYSDDRIRVRSEGEGGDAEAEETCWRTIRDHAGAKVITVEWKA